jgi:hypothetical protein
MECKMSFLKGSMSFFRCQFGACANVDPLEVLEAHKFGTQKIARPDGAEYGFVAGEMFDLAFEHGKTPTFQRKKGVGGWDFNERVL